MTGFRIFFFFSVTLVFYGFQNCSPVDFSKVAEQVTLRSTGERKLCSAYDFLQPNEPKTDMLDLLFVMDTSGSLDQERNLIAQESGAFLNALPSTIKVNVAVALAHGSLSGQSGKLYQIDANDPAVLKGELLTNAQIIAGLQAKMTAVVNNNVRDDNADGGEEGLFAVSELLKPGPLATAQGQGFFRPAGALAVIFVGDEADICARDAGGNPLAMTSNNGGVDVQEMAAFNRDCANVSPMTVYADLQLLKPDLPLILASITYLAAADGEIGNGYLETVDLDMGIKADLANNMFGATLTKIGELASERLALIDRVEMAFLYEAMERDGLHDLDMESLTVSVDGAEAPFEIDDVEEMINLLSTGKPDSSVEIEFCETPIEIYTDTNEPVEEI